MPSLGADMEAGTLVEWLIEPGDRVNRGDVVAVVETEKGAIDVEIFLTGEVEKILVPVGAKVPVGTVLAFIRVSGEQAEAMPESQTTVPPAADAEKDAVAPAAVAGADGRPRISPAARKRAAELALDLATLRGTGPGGSITLADVEQAARTRPSEPKVDRRTAMRQAIAAAMAHSKREIPHYYLQTSIDMGRAMAWLRDENQRRPITQRLLYAVLLVKAVALALRKAPELNGFWIDGGFRPSREIHVGMAISLRGGGLVVPALHRADDRSMDDLMGAFRELVQRARTGSLRSSELSDATITLTSLGERSVDTVFGIIYPPQVALVGFGQVADRPWSVNGEVQSRPMITATLAGDHRASDGHRGAGFLKTVDRLLQQPETL